MKDLVLKCEWKEWTNRETGEIKKYRVFYVEWAGLRIPVKAGDNTAHQLLNQLFDNMESK